MPGMPELAEQIFDFPVRRCAPRGIGGLVDVVRSPMYATGVGLVLYGSKCLQDARFKVRDEGVYSKVKERMRNWIEDIF